MPATLYKLLAVLL